MAELTPLEARYLDKALDTQLALWSALLQLEGLLLAVASIFAALAPNQAVPATVVIIAALAAGTLLLWNFTSTRSMYLRIGQTLNKRRNPSEGDIPQAARQFSRLRWSERGVLALLAVQGLAVVWASVKLTWR